MARKKGIKVTERLKTKMWHVDKSVDNLRTTRSILEAAERLKKNEVVAFPTETVYGLGANACSDEAVKRIFEAKGRPVDNPLIVHIASFNQLNGIVRNIPETAKKLMKRFWPGPLTLILPKGEGISRNATAGLQTIGVRMPDHPVALALIEAANLPIAAPSANRSGKPSPTAAEHVLTDLNGKIAGVIDAGSTGIGVESTVIECGEDQITILRPGGITQSELEDVLSKENVHEYKPSKTAAPKSPGMKYTHYSPDAPVYLIDAKTEDMQQVIDKQKANGKRVGVLTTEEKKHLYHADYVVACGERRNLFTVAEQLYSALRKFDDQHVDIILSETFPKEGIGEAIMNRLEKAAVKKV